MTTPSPLTPADLADIRKRCESIEGPTSAWCTLYRADVPKLVAALEAAWAENERLVAAWREADMKRGTMP